MSYVQSPSTSGGCTPRAPKTPSRSNSSVARTCSQAETTADGAPSSRTGSHRNTPGPNVGGLATSSARRANDIERGSEAVQSKDAVAIIERLDRDLDTFLPLLEGVPPLFRSRVYHHGKIEFLNVKEIVSGTVKTLRATQHGDVRIIISQYLLFRDMIYDNLRNLLLWLDEELEKYNKARQKGTSTLKLV
jgi:hypothetical protein